MNLTSDYSTAAVELSPGASNTNGEATYRVPLTMPLGQRYYWSPEWQNGEREAMREFEAGESIRFDSEDPEDIARWLDESED